MFRLIVAVLAVFGLGALIFGGGHTGSIAWLLVLAPLIFISKMFLFFALFGMVTRALWRRDGGTTSSFNRSGRHRRHRAHGAAGERSKDRPSEADRFDEWHRMAHAREEVATWTPDEAWVEGPE